MVCNEYFCFLLNISTFLVAWVDCIEATKLFQIRFLLLSKENFYCREDKSLHFDHLNDIGLFNHLVSRILEASFVPVRLATLDTSATRKTGRHKLSNILLRILTFSRTHKV